eukprot:TRINITY_DN3222_c0_g1_i5.p4 TRINITY_DN3222_c0_g1~~TRINITY_DN3222_c0_g1_i5.p4  ORF type:complete len:100 (+),score=14.91 TRINITY_DN3222_c0_g1_i5:909-1208(+)
MKDVNNKDWNLEAQKTSFSVSLTTILATERLFTLNLFLPLTISETQILATISTFKVSIVFCVIAVSYTHLRAHETRHDLVCRLLLEKKNLVSSSFDPFR